MILTSSHNQLHNITRSWNTFHFLHSVQNIYGW